MAHIGMGSIDLVALQAVTDRIRSQIDTLEGREDDTGESNAGESDGEARVERPHARHNSGHVAVTGLTRADLTRLGITKNFLRPRRGGTQQNMAVDDVDSDEDGSSSDGDFLQFLPSDLRHIDESFSVGMSRQQVQELLSKFRADERTVLAEEVCEWFNGAASNSGVVEDELNKHEASCREEEMQMDEAHRELGTHIQSRDVATIQHMRAFYEKIQEFRPKKPLQVAKAAAATPKSDRGEKTLSEVPEEPGASTTGNQVRHGSQVLRRGGGGTGSAPLPSSALGQGGGAAAAGGRAPGPRSAARRQGQGNSILLRSDGEVDEGPDPAEDEVSTMVDVTTRQGRRTGLMGANELLRRAAPGPEEAAQANSDRRKPTNFKTGGQFLASDLLEVIAQQQDEIAHLKTRNDFSIKGTETMRTALEFVRSQAHYEEASVFAGGNHNVRGRRETVAQIPEAAKEVLSDIREKLKVKVVGELIMSKEGREQLRAVEGNNAAIAQQLRTAELMEEVESLQGQVKELEAELAQTMAPAQRVEVLKQEIEARQAELGPRQPSRPSTLEPPRAGGLETSPSVPPSIPPSPGPGSRAPSKHTASMSRPSSSLMHAAQNYGWLVEAPEAVVKQIEGIFTEVEKHLQELQNQRERLADAVGAAKHRAAMEEEEKTKGTVNFQDTPEDATLEDLRVKVKDAQQQLMEVREEAQTLQTEEEELRAELKRLRENKKQVAQAMAAATREEGRLLIASRMKGNASPKKSVAGTGGEEAAPAGDAAGGQEEAAGGAEKGGGNSHHEKVVVRLQGEVETVTSEIETLEEKHKELEARVERLRKARAEEAEQSAASSPEKAVEAKPSAELTLPGPPQSLALARTSSKAAAAHSPEASTVAAGDATPTAAGAVSVPGTPQAKGGQVSVPGTPQAKGGGAAGSAVPSFGESFADASGGGSPTNLFAKSPDGTPQANGNHLAPELVVTSPKGSASPALSTRSAATGPPASPSGAQASLPADSQGAPGGDARPNTADTSQSVRLKSKSTTGPSSPPPRGSPELEREGEAAEQAGPSSAFSSEAAADREEAGEEGAKVGRGRLSTLSAQIKHDSSVQIKHDSSGHSRSHSFSVVAQQGEGQQKEQHPKVKTIVEDKREEQVQDLLMYQSEHTRLERQIADIEERIREAKLKAQGKKSNAEPRQSIAVKSLIIPEENRAMRREVTLKQRELNMLRKRWWSEKSQGGPQEDLFAGQAELAAGMLLLAPPEVPASAQEEPKEEEGSDFSSSSSEEREDEEGEAPQPAPDPQPQQRERPSGSALLGRAWLGLEAASTPRPAPKMPNMQRRHSMHPAAMALDWRRQHGSLEEGRRTSMQRRSSFKLNRNATAAPAAAEGGEGNEISPMEQFERILLTTGLPTPQGQDSSAAAPRNVSIAGGGGRRGSVAGGRIPGQLLRRRMSQPAFMYQPEGDEGAGLGLVVRRATGLQAANEELASNRSSFVSSSSGSDEPRKESSEQQLSEKKPPLPRRPSDAVDEPFGPRRSPLAQASRSMLPAGPGAALQAANLTPNSPVPSLQAIRLSVPSSPVAPSPPPAASPAGRGAEGAGAAEGVELIHRRKSWGGRLTEADTARPPQELLSALQVTGARKSVDSAAQSSSEQSSLSSLLRSVPVDPARGGPAAEAEHITAKEVRSILGSVLEKQ